MSGGGASIRCPGRLIGGKLFGHWWREWLGFGGLLIGLSLGLYWYDEYVLYQGGDWAVGNDYAEAVNRAALLGSQANEFPFADREREGFCTPGLAGNPPRPESYRGCFAVKAGGHCGLGFVATPPTGPSQAAMALVTGRGHAASGTEGRFCLVLETSAALWEDSKIRSWMSYGIEYPCRFSEQLRQAGYMGCGRLGFVVFRVRLVVVKDTQAPPKGANIVETIDFWPRGWIELPN
jgi:hypothetical protein